MKTNFPLVCVRHRERGEGTTHGEAVGVRNNEQSQGHSDSMFATNFHGRGRNILIRMLE